MFSGLSTGGRHAGQSILLVCNKSQEVFCIETLLQRFIYTVSVAPTAAKALDQVALSVPSLVVTDVDLPVLTGLDLVNMLRTDPRSSSIPVVLLVSGRDAHASDRYRDIGAAGMVTMPVQAEELYRVIQRAIEPVPRVNIRIETRLPVVVDNVRIADPDGRCRVELSEQGMFVPTQKQYAQNDRISLRLQIENRTIDAECTVLYSSTIPAISDKMPGVGLKFSNIMPVDQELIRKYIHDEVTRGIGA